MTTAFTDHVRLLLDLHRLFLRGEDEGPEADTVRDAMDSPWHSMTKDERRLSRKLSAHLYSVGDRSAAAPPAQEVQVAFVKARNDERWEEVLDLLRDHPGLAAPGQRALLRGRAWDALGAGEAAREFYRDAEAA